MNKVTIKDSTLRECELPCDPFIQLLEETLGEKIPSETIWLGHLTRGDTIRVTWWPK